MKEFKGTPGPWFVNYGTHIEDESGSNICEVLGDITDLEEDEANANLIAAAPELLDVLQKLLYSFNDRDFVGLQVGYKIEAEAAIAKALGE